MTTIIPPLTEEEHQELTLVVSKEDIAALELDQLAELFPADAAADDGTAIELDVQQEEQELDDHLYTLVNTSGLQSSQDTAQGNTGK